MAAVQPLKYTGGALGTLDGAADDTRFNSLGVGAAATGTTGIVNFTVAARGPDGTLAAPAFAFTTEPNTGLRLAAAGDLRAVVAGADALLFAGSGLVTAPVRLLVKSGTDYSFEIQSAAGTTLMAWRNTASPHLDVLGSSYGLFYNGQITGARFGVTSDAVASICGVFKGVASQTADLTQWRDSANAVLAKITAAGILSPHTDNARDFGETGTRWKTLFGYTGDFSTRVIVGNGSLTAPGLGFAGETNTGLRLAAAGDLRVVVAGADVLTLSAAGLTMPGTLDLGNLLEMANVKGIRWGSTGGPLISGSNVDDTLIFETGTIERMRIDSTGLITVAGRITGVAAPTAANDATRADAAGPNIVTTFFGIIQNTLDPNYATPGTSNTNASEANSQARVPFDCVVRAMYIDAGAGPTGAAVAWTLRKAGLGTTMTASLAVSATQASKTDVTVAYTAGEMWALEVDPAVGYDNNSCTNVRVTLAVTRR